MRITYLIEDATGIWGGVKNALEAANLLHGRGHEVTIVSRSAPPTWMQLDCGFERAPDFGPDHVPDSDVVIGTFWTTVPWAARCGKGTPVHYVQGYEGHALLPGMRTADVEAVYRLDGVHKITISPHLQRTLHELFGCDAHLVRYMVDHDVMRPDPQAPQRLRTPGHRVRVGLVGPYNIDWKDIRTGLEACALASKAGLDLQLVRVTNVDPQPGEQDLPFPVEWHVKVPPAEMGAIYRSMDVFLGTSRGKEEGFFLPAVEAMACGVPTVLTEIPCFTGYGRGQYSLFVSPQSPAEMAEALVLVSRHRQVADELRQNGIVIASQFTSQRHVDDLENALEAILEPRRHIATAQQPRGSDLDAISASIAKALAEASDVYLSSSRYDEALRHAEAASGIQPNDLVLRQRVAHARYRAGDNDGALEIYDELVRGGSEDPEVHGCRGMILFARADYSKAVTSFERAIALGGETSETLNNLGVAYYRAGRSSDARLCFGRALELQPGCPDASANLRRLAETSGIHPAGR